MRIALLTGEYPPSPGGVGDYTYRLGSALSARGHGVVVLTGSNAKVTPDEQPPVIRLAGGWGWQSSGRVLGALRLIRPDVLNIQYQTGAYDQHPAIDLLPALLRRRLGLPVVVTAHDLRLPYLLPKADWLRRWVTRALLRGADAVIVSNAEDRARLAGQLAGDRDHFAGRIAGTTQIPIGVNIPVDPPTGYDRAAWRARLGLRDRQVVGYFGLLNASKGISELVEAIASLPPSVQLLLIGGAATSPADRAYAAELDDMIARNGLAGRITRTGACPAREVSGHLLACDVVALPFVDGASYRRGSLLAALLHGVPVVTTQPPQPLDPPLVDGQNVRLIAQATPAVIARALLQLLDNPELCHRIAAGGRHLAAQFDWSGIAAAHEVVYNALIVGDFR